MSRIISVLLLAGAGVGFTLPSTVSSLSAFFFSDSSCTSRTDLLGFNVPFITDNQIYPVDGKCQTNATTGQSGQLYCVDQSVNVKAWDVANCPNGVEAKYTFAAKSIVQGQCSPVDAFDLKEHHQLYAIVDCSNKIIEQRQKEQTEAAVGIQLDSGFLGIETNSTLYLLPAYVIDEPFFGSTNFSNYNYTYHLEYILEIPQFYIVNITQEVGTNITDISLAEIDQAIPVFEVEQIGGAKEMNKAHEEPKKVSAKPPMMEAPKKPFSHSTRVYNGTEIVRGNLTISSSYHHGLISCHIASKYVDIHTSGANCTDVKLIHKACGGNSTMYDMDMGHANSTFSVWKLQQQIHRHLRTQIEIEFNLTKSVQGSFNDAEESAVITPKTNGSVSYNYSLHYSVNHTSHSNPQHAEWLAQHQQHCIDVRTQAHNSSINCYVSLSNTKHHSNGTNCTDTDYHANVMIGNMLAVQDQQDGYLMAKQQREQSQKTAETNQAILIGLGVSAGVGALFLAGVLLAKRSLRSKHGYLPGNTR